MWKWIAVVRNSNCFHSKILLILIWDGTPNLAIHGNYQFLSIFYWIKFLQIFILFKLGCHAESKGWFSQLKRHPLTVRSHIWTHTAAQTLDSLSSYAIWAARFRATLLTLPENPQWLYNGLPLLCGHCNKKMLLAQPSWLAHRLRYAGN